MFLKRAFLLLYFSLIGQVLFAQLATNIRFDHLTMNDGLSSNSVASVFEDSRGLYWIATQDGGLNRFDGKNVKVYKTDSLNPNSISSDFVTNIMEDKEGMLWVSCYDQGICRFDPITEKFKRYQHDSLDNNSISEGYVNVAMQDSKGRIWVAIWGGGLNLYDPKTDGFIHFEFDEKDEKKIGTTQVKDIREDKDGMIWFTCWSGNGKKNRLQKLDPNTREFSTIKKDKIVSPEGKPLEGARQGLDIIHKVFIDSESNVWYATYLGLYKYTPSTGIFIRYYSDENDKSGISFNNLRSITQDKYGDLWLGSLGGGLNRFNPKTGKFTVYNFNYNNNSSISDNMVRGIFIDSKERIWIGSYAGGMNIIDPIKQEFQLIPNDSLKAEFADKSGQGNKVGSIAVGKNNLIYAQSGAGLAEYNYQTNKLQNIYKQSEGEYNKLRIYYVDDKLYGSRWSKFASFNLASKKWSDWLAVILWEGQQRSATVNHICRTPDGKIAVSAFRRGVGFLDTKTDSVKFDHTTEAIKDLRHFNPNFSGFSLLSTGDAGLFVCAKDFSIIKQLKKDTARIVPDTPNDNIVLLTFKDAHKNVWVSTRKNLYLLDTLSFEMKPSPLNEQLGDDVVMSMENDKNGNVWLLTETRLFKYNITTGRFLEFDASLGLFSRRFGDKIEKDENGFFFLASSEGIVKFKPENLIEPTVAPKLFISSIKLFGKDHAADSAAFVKRNYTFDYFNNSISFGFGCTDLTNQSKVNYYYKLTGNGNDTAWVEAGNNTMATFNNLSPGSYVFSVKSINSFGLISETGNVRIIITPPFWRTTWFYLLCALAAGGLVYSYIRYRERALQRAKAKLEHQVKKRTEEVVMQKEIIEQKNKEMLDSISYAKTIQEAILPSIDLFKSCFADNFVLFKPKDIVSGDFYWISKHGDIVYYATCDCTGHGVPGGFMSMLGSSLLNETVDESNITEPSEVLNHLCDRMIVSLKQQVASSSSRDGMDMSFCRVDTKTMELTYAGANNGLYIIRDGKIVHHDGTKQPIGIHTGERKEFQSFKVALKKGDLIYSYTDGYADQFGGDKGKKLKWANLEKVLLMHWQRPMNEQLKEIDTIFETWKGHYEQLDDVLIIGIRI